MGQRARGTSIDQRYVISNTQATKVLSNHISIPSSRAPQHMQSSIDQHLYHYQDTRLLRFEQKISSTLFFIWASKHIESSKYQRYIITKTQDYWGSNTQPPQIKRTDVGFNYFNTNRTLSQGSTNKRPHQINY